jgi:polyisoprenoid-binding protein YceI
MAMRRALVLLIAGLVGVAGPATRAIDPARSTASFSVAHIWVERVSGTVPILEGSMTFAGDSTIPTAATAVLDATRILTDEPDRNRALKSSDFFDVAKFQRWTFESTKIVPKAADGFEMDGNLTIHGVTQPEQLTVTVSGTPGAPHYHATGQIDRHAFGMAVTRLDPTIGGSVDIMLDVTLK